MGGGSWRLKCGGHEVRVGEAGKSDAEGRVGGNRGRVGGNGGRVGGKGPPLLCDPLSPPSLTLPFSTHLTLPIKPEGQGGFATRVREGVRTEIRPGTMAWRNLGVCESIGRTSVSRLAELVFLSNTFVAVRIGRTCFSFKHVCSSEDWQNSFFMMSCLLCARRLV